MRDGEKLENHTQRFNENGRYNALKLESYALVDLYQYDTEEEGKFRNI